VNRNMRSRGSKRHSCTAAVIGAMVCCIVAAQTHAMTFDFPGPSQPTADRREALTSHPLPVGPYRAGRIETLPTEGPMAQSAWRITAPRLTTLQLLAPLRDQLIEAGYRVLFECETAGCGGFDFRYGLDLLPEPDMHVDLGDFRYLAAERAGTDVEANGTDYLSLVVSQSADTGFVQITHIGSGAVLAPALTTPTKVPATATPDMPAPSDIPDIVAPAPPGPFGARLLSGGAVPLDDLVFPSGTAALADGDYASLAELAGWLKVNPAATVTVVGHTDTSGGLAGNTALSRQRAGSVRDRLIRDFGVPAAQITAEGVGYLAPRASNLTEEGRRQNRRVEVMLTSTQTVP